MQSELTGLTYQTQNVSIRLLSLPHRMVEASAENDEFHRIHDPTQHFSISVIIGVEIGLTISDT